MDTQTRGQKFGEKQDIHIASKYFPQDIVNCKRKKW